MKILCINCASRVAKEAYFEDETPSKPITPDGIGHRIVHGGPKLSEPTLITDRVLDTLREWIPYAPLSLPQEILSIESCRNRFPNTPQVACFDTHFHASLPRASKEYPIPHRYYDSGLHKYGFDGLICEYITTKHPLPGRTIIASIGKSTSLTALLNGKPIDTTRGFSPMGGGVMGTHSGDLDPGVLLHIMRIENKTVDDIEHLLSFESGLLGLSGQSSDIEKLLSDENHPTIDRFCHSIQQSIGALSATLEGLDHLVFTGELSENLQKLYRNITKKLRFLGDFQTHYEPCYENLMIARHTKKLIK